MRPFVCWLIRQGTSMLCQIDGEALVHVPPHGPLILVTNHIGSLEVPLLYAYLHPRPLTGLAKVETWDNPLLAWLFDLFQAIPVRRGTPDLAAIRRSLDALRAGYILAVAPEGTRSRHGRLLRGQAGVVTLALHSGAPLLPLAHWGSEQFHANLRRWKRTPFHIRVGRPFRIEPGGRKLTRALRRQITDEIMMEIAALLPPEYRGFYAFSLEAPRFLRYL